MIAQKIQIFIDFTLWVRIFFSFTNKAIEFLQKICRRLKDHIELAFTKV